MLLLERTLRQIDFDKPRFGKFFQWSVVLKSVAPLRFPRSACADPTEDQAVIPLPCLTQLSGAGEGIRTPDPLITNQMLYQLSYASKTEPAQLDRSASRDKH